MTERDIINDGWLRWHDPSLAPQIVYIAHTWQGIANIRHRMLAGRRDLNAITVAAPTNCLPCSPYDPKARKMRMQGMNYVPLECIDYPTVGVA